MADLVKSRDLTPEAWRQMSLMDKWKTSYNQDYADKGISNRAAVMERNRQACESMLQIDPVPAGPEEDQAEEGCSINCTPGTIILWYVAFSMEYVVIAFMTDDIVAHWDPRTRYYVKVWCTFVFIQVAANWLCTVCYQSDLRETRDNPSMQKLLWDEHPAENGATENVIRVEDLNGDRTGLVWKWCQMCKMNQPPRAHHCKVCQKCILKRDHHCFFTGSCIGYYNQRFFVMLVFYLTVASYGYMPFLYYYTTEYYSPLTKGWADYFLPCTMYNWWFEGLAFKYVILVSHWYTVWWGGLMASAFFCIQMVAISKGLTPHEMQKVKDIRSTATMGENFRDVFSSFWLVNFIFPAVVVFRPMGDGKYWTHMKKT